MSTSVASPAILVRGHHSPIGAAVVVALRASGRRVILDGDRLGRDRDASLDCIVDARLADYDQVGRLGSDPAGAVVDTTELADANGVGHVVVVTSAMVYGALPNNPLPLTEDAVLRPAPEFEFACQLAAAEAVVDEWRRGREGRSVAVLRPAVPISSQGNSSLVSALTAGLGQRFAQDDPPAQFVHVDDIAAAVAVMVDDQLDGVYNVAPDSWIPGDRLRALVGGRLRVPLPDRVAEVVESLRWRFQRGPIPPGVGPYIRAPWVVANDKLKRTGWSAVVTNEQAFVEGTESPWWSTITPQRRQELSLLGLAVGVVAALGGIAGLVRWWMRRRR